MLEWVLNALLQVLAHSRAYSIIILLLKVKAFLTLVTKQHPPPGLFFPLVIQTLPLPVLFFPRVIKTLPEAVVRMCSVKKMFLKIWKNSQENTCARASFLITLQASEQLFYRIPSDDCF